jgi:hypothetical protein
MLGDGDRHLHIDRRDSVADMLGRALSAARSGTVSISFAGEHGGGEGPAAKITAGAREGGSEIAVDLLQPSAFVVLEDETDLFDKLKTAAEFGRKLSDAGVTVSFLRKGKEAVRLGRGASPTLSRLITRSGDIQLSSVREFAKLKGDLKTTD